MRYLALFVTLGILAAFPALAADPTVTILDSTGGDTGPTQSTGDDFLRKDIPLRMVADIGSGDTVVIEGSTASGGTFITIYSFTADEWKDIWVPRFWRARRSVDGGSADSTVTVINTPNIPLTAD